MIKNCIGFCSVWIFFAKMSTIHGCVTTSLRVFDWPFVGGITNEILPQSNEVRSPDVEDEPFLPCFLNNIPFVKNLENDDQVMYFGNIIENGDSSGYFTDISSLKISRVSTWVDGEEVTNEYISIVLFFRQLD